MSKSRNFRVSAYGKALIMILFMALLASCSLPQALPMQPAGSPVQELVTSAADSAVPTASETPVASTPLPTPTPTATFALVTATATPPPTPTPTATPTKKPVVKAAPKPTPKPYTLPYVIYVEKGSHTITIYGKDGVGKYTKVVRQFLTATGKTAMLTPTGTFKIKGKERWHKFGGTAYAQYASLYYSSTLFFHSPLYSMKNNNTLKVLSYTQIGTNATAGCMRTTTGAAYWIYKNCAVGTKVQIVNGSPKGTKAGAIPSISMSATYDPTDPIKPAAAPAPTASPSAEPTTIPDVSEPPAP